MKGGLRARVTGFTTLEVKSGFRRFSVSSFLNHFVHPPVDLYRFVFGGSIRFLDSPTPGFIPAFSGVMR
jgi:hypothetical protein